MRVAVAPLLEIDKQAVAVEMVAREDNGQRDFGVHPALPPPAGEKRNQQPEQHRADAQRRHEFKQALRHAQKLAVFRAACRHHGQVHIDARQVKQAGKPRNNKERGLGSKITQYSDKLLK